MRIPTVLLCCALSTATFGTSPADAVVCVEVTVSGVPEPASDLNDTYKPFCATNNFCVDGHNPAPPDPTVTGHVCADAGLGGTP